MLSGTSQLTVQFSASDAARPLQQVDLFVDGKFFRTLTNIAPAAGNQVKVRIGNQSVSYTVPANATLASIANGLAAALNAPAISNVTRTTALPIGDRVELRYLTTNRPVAPLNLRTAQTGASTPTNFSGPAFGTAIGSAAVVTTLMTPARSGFLDSPVVGQRNCFAIGNASVGTWLRLTVTKTNGAVVTVSVTNSVSGATAVNVLSNLFGLLKAEPALQGADGVVGEDFTVTTATAANFNLLARSPGLKAAGLRIVLSSSSALIVMPTAESTLTANLNDLQPRNHLYLNAGVADLAVVFAFNTATLPDGYHELAAVAYEGSHVRTQTRVTVPVRIQNTPLAATLNLIDFVATNAVTGNYSVQVTANTNNITSITLYSTGGVIGTVSNQAAATFTVVGTNLGVGAHPFYALVQDTFGRRFRTALQTVRFQ